MAAVAVERHQSSLAWPIVPQFNARTRFQPGPPAYISEPRVQDPPIPPHNEIELTRDRLINILEYFSQLVAQLFTGLNIRMVVHGGACMLLHPGLHNLSQQQHLMIPSLPRRTTTRDVDYIHRSFISELASYGMPDAAVKLQECIRTTARHFGLGADWMNSDADIALPMAHDPSGNVYDPIYTASIKQNNIDLHTIFRSTNGALTLISVTPFWAVSLKLVRYTRWDPGDICLLLRNGTVLSGTNWTPETLEDWLFRNCWPMGYHNFDSRKKAEMRARIDHAIKMLSDWSSAVQPPETCISAHDAMGGGDVMDGGEYEGNNGWGYSFGTWPNQGQQSQAQVSAVHFPVLNVPPPASAPVNVRDWAKDNDPPPKRKSRSPSPYSHSRRSSTGEAREIFIPPDTGNWINHNHNQPPISFRPRSRNPSPDPVADMWYPAESNNFRSASRGIPRADPYSLESFDRSLSSMIYQSNHRNANLVVPSNTQPVIPISLVRKQKVKRRKRDRDRERQSKWLPRSGRLDSDTSDSSDDENMACSIPERSAWDIYAQRNTHQPPPPPQIRMPPPPIHSNSRSQSQQGPQNPILPTQHRPPPLNLSPPVTAPPLVSQMPVPVVNHIPIGLHSPPQSLGPAQLAQYQFEQQREVYQFQQQQQQQQQQQRLQQQRQHHHHHPHHQQHQSFQSWPNAGVAVYR